jgi:glycosyltransferase involved in cell wall biosynthesis
MLKADLHVHTKYSDRPSEWLLQRLGTAESYTEPDYLYETALKRGMDLVAVTDHNKIDGALYLKGKYPDKTIVSVEATTYFPEDGCKIHLLIYGIDEKQFTFIQKLRENIYDLRDYIKEQHLAHSVAHATFSINKRLTTEHIEKLILLFDTFEAINGSRNSLNNEVLFKLLRHLTVSDIERLYIKHKIYPYSDTSWIKGFTGGSDDHAGIFIGTTYTTAEAYDINSFLLSLKEKKTSAAGRENNFEGFAFAIYKIAYEFSKSKSTTFAKSAISEFTKYIFEKEQLSFLDRIKLHRFKSSLTKNNNNGLTQTLVDIIDNLKTIQSFDIDKKLDYIYNKIAYAVDEYIKSIFKSLDEDLSNYNVINIIKTISASIPGILLASPFFSSFKFMYNDRQLLNNVKMSFEKEKLVENKKILWFTDTIVDLNGVSVTLKTLAKKAFEAGYQMYIATSLTKDEIKNDLPKNLINIDPVYNFKLPYYESLTIKIPSILKLLKEVYKFSPDEIYISTPGPVGFTGILISQMLDVPAVCIYHTDFAAEVDKIAGDKRITNIVDSYMKWFYNLSDKMLVPTYEYMNILKSRGYYVQNAGIFRRGLDVNKFKPAIIKDNYKTDVINLLYTGRISKDKNLEFLFKVAQKLHNNSVHKFLLTIVGDGPDYENYKKTYTSNFINFTGRLPYDELPDLYEDAHLFLFPSTTDTFGMAVLEAQCSGLPAVVSNVGGPKEIVLDNITGFSLPIKTNLWIEKILEIFEMIKQKPEIFNQLKEKARKHISDNYDLNIILREMFKKNSLLTTLNEHKYLTFSGLKELASGLLAS